MIFHKVAKQLVPFPCRTCRVSGVRCLGLMTFFGCMSAIFYPVLWIGVIVLSLVPQIGQLYAPPLVILTAFGTVYGLLMIAIYYLNTRVGQWSTIL